MTEGFFLVIKVFFFFLEKRNKGAVENYAAEAVDFGPSTNSEYKGDHINALSKAHAPSNEDDNNFQVLYVSTARVLGNLTEIYTRGFLVVP